MPGEDQERFEDYLDLENYIEQLQAGKIAHPPKDLTPEQIRVYQTANLFRAALPGASEPDSTFSARLHDLLEQELKDMREETRPRPALPASSSEKTPAQTPDSPQAPHRRAAFSRRNLLTGGVVAAASLVIGGGIEKVVEQVSKPSGTGQANVHSAEPLVPADLHSAWHHVGTLAKVMEDAVPFTTESVIGYALMNKDDPGESPDPDSGKVIAVSAACTHMGCLVQWETSDRKFHCPCHGGLFTEYGRVDNYSGAVRYLSPLPRLDTKVENGNVYVRVPLKRG